MMSTTRRRTHPIDDPLLHLTGPFAPSPTASPTHSPATHFHHVPSAASAAAAAPPSFSLFGLATLPLPRITPTGAPDPARVHPALRWAVSPAAALRLLLLPPLLALPTHFLLPLLLPLLPPYLQDAVANPFTPFFLLSHLSPPPARLSAAAPLPDARTGLHGPLYVKGPGDLLLVAYAVVLFSFLRLVLSHYLLPALGRRGGIRKEGKLLRFGEQGYSVIYFAVVGVWGVYTMSTTRTLWFRTAHFWLDYPHTHLSAAMKRYYLGQVGFWVQQFLVLTLALEKRRSDHWELVLHHCVTVWMVSWSYLMNVTLLGSAVFMSMDIPDMMLSVRVLVLFFYFFFVRSFLGGGLSGVFWGESPFG
ncbi:TLC domain-containing protein [Mycena galericulata]|nr:TLC domain-containing protein [Mycena galericulata]